MLIFFFQEKTGYHVFALLVGLGKCIRGNYWPALNVDGKFARELVPIPQFYTPFYVYKYATGYSAATAFASAILENKPKAVEKYLHFLASGGSDYSLNLLKTAGVDLTTPLPETVTLHKSA